MDIYKIRIKDHLEDYWKNQFRGMKLVNLDDGEVELIGALENQDRLFELLTKIRDLNLILISIDHFESFPDLQKESTDKE